MFLKRISPLKARWKGHWSMGMKAVSRESEWEIVNLWLGMQAVARMRPLSCQHFSAVWCGSLQLLSKLNYLNVSLRMFTFRRLGHGTCIGGKPLWLYIGVFHKLIRNSVNLINHWSMNSVQFKDPLCYPCLASAVVGILVSCTGDGRRE